jgi:hypothetical protein
VKAEDVPAFAKMMRGWFAKRGAAAGELDDIEQDAAVAALETTARYAAKANWGYCFQAAKDDAGLALARRLAVPSVSEYAVAGGRGGWDAGNGGWTWAFREDVDAATPDHRTPAALVEAVQEEAGRERLMRILGARVEELPRRDRKPLRLMLGLGTGPALELADAAKASRRTGAYVSRAKRRLAALVSQDQEAIQARRVTCSA